MGATIAHIAARAGVSKATVSRALADSPLIKSATKMRIRRLAEEVGYRPNPIARSLLSGRTQTLGFVITSLTNSFFAEVAEAMHRAAGERGYDLLIALDDRKPDLEARQVEHLLDRRVDGVLLWGGQPHRDSACLARLREGGVPHVVLATEVVDQETSFVTVDRIAGMEQGVDHLARMGMSRLSFMGSDVELSVTAHEQSKYAGFLAALQRRRLEPAASIRCRVPDLTPGDACAVGYEAGSELAAHLDRPRAVLCSGDQLALGLIAGLRDGGLSVPRDVAVVGFDGIADGEYSYPRLTTVAQPVTELVEQGLAAVLDQLEGPAMAPRRIRVPPRLVVRESCGARKPTQPDLYDGPTQERGVFP